MARQKLSDLVFGQEVSVDEQDIDRYGRVVAIVYNETGVCVNEEMLKSGLAWNYREYNKQHPEWDLLEARARQQKAGLWSLPAPVAPWDFRKIKQPAKSKKSRAKATV